QESFPSSTRMAQSVAVMALVQEPMWKRSFKVIFAASARRRMPAAPEARMESESIRATTMPGTLCLMMIGSISEEMSRGGAAEATSAQRRIAIATEIFFTSLSQFSHRLFFCFLHHIRELYRRAPLPFAHIGGLHESEQFERLGAAHRWFARLEERRDLLDERLVTFILSGLGDAILAENGCSI